MLPATWMQYHIDNRSGKEETQLLFSLQQAAQRGTGLERLRRLRGRPGQLDRGEEGDAELLDANRRKQAFGVDGATSAFCVHVPPGAEKTVTFYIAQYQPGVITAIQDAAAAR